MKKRLWRRKVATILGVGGVLLFQSSALATVGPVVDADVVAGDTVTTTNNPSVYLDTAAGITVGAGAKIEVIGITGLPIDTHLGAIANRSTATGTITIEDGVEVEITVTAPASDQLAGTAIFGSNSVTINGGNNIVLSATGEHEAKGIYLRNSSVASFGDDLTITVTGTGSSSTAGRGIGMADNAMLTIGENLVVNVNGSGGAGILQMAAGGTLSIGDNAALKTTGENSRNVQAQGGAVTFLGKTTLISDDIKSLSAVASSGGTIDFMGDTAITVLNDGESLAIWSTGANSTVEALGGNLLAIEGDVVADTGGQIDLEFGSGSTLKGNVSNTGGGGTINMEMDNTTWTLESYYTAVGTTSELDTLNLNGGSKVDFQGTGDWTLNVTDLGGDGTGEIHMRADTTAGTGDFLSVTNLNSNQGIFITDTSGNVGGATSLNVASITNDHGNVLNLLNPGGVVDAGAFQYDLQDIGSGAYDLVQTGQLSTTAAYVPNIVRTVYYTNYVETNSLMKRMGDLRSNSDNGNVWARGFVGQINADARGNLGEYKQNYHGFQVGMDKKISSNDVRDIYVGGHLGYTSSNNDYRAAGNGDTASYYGGVYGTYHRPNTGFYVDGVLKVGSVKHEQEIVQSGLILAKDSDRASAWALSFEAGQRFFFGNGKAERQGFYLEPQAKLAVAQTGDYSFNLAGTQVDVENDTSFMSRLGFLAGYEVKKGKNPINVYGKLSWVKEYGNDLTTTVSGVTLKDSMSDNWWAYGLGATAKIGERHNLYLDLERASGGNFTQDWQVTGGYRFQW